MAFCFILKLKITLFLPLLSFAVTHCHLLSLVVIRCHSIYHFLSFAVTRFVTLCRYLSLVVPLVVIRCTTRSHSLSLVVPIFVTLTCLFLNDPSLPLELRIKVKFNFCTSCAASNDFLKAVKEFGYRKHRYIQDHVKHLRRCFWRRYLSTLSC